MGFFDNLDHDLMIKAVRKHAPERWMELYIERWLKAPAQEKRDVCWSVNEALRKEE